MPEQDDSKSWISAVVEGGLPQILAGPAGKAISRLIGATVEIPAAYLEGITQGIRDKTDARTTVLRAIAEKTADIVKDDPEILERAAANMLSRAYRVQKNKDAVAAVALEQLDVDPPPISSQGPSEDWISTFERYAEDAAGDDLREMWGRVLAGEIRQPGRYSRRTLRFLSEVSQSDAIAFERVSRIAFGDFVPAILGKPPESQDITDLISLETNGLIQGSMTGLVRSHVFDKGGYAYVNEGSLYILFRGAPETPIDFSVYLLTSLGKELLSVIPSRDVLEAAKTVANACKEPRILECHLGVLAEDLGPGKLKIIETLWKQDTSPGPIEPVPEVNSTETGLV